MTLAGRYPELWKAACDLFGPYDLFTFLDRLPETWKTYFYLTLGHPEQEREFLIERSPKTYLQQLSCPLLVIQGARPPRAGGGITGPGGMICRREGDASGVLGL